MCQKPGRKDHFEGVGKDIYEYLFKKNLKYTNIDLGKYCKDQDIEVYLVKQKSTFFKACITAVYRAPTGNFNLFLNRLDNITKTLYKVDLKLICGDTDIDYLTHNDKKK